MRKCKEDIKSRSYLPLPSGKWLLRVELGAFFLHELEADVNGQRLKQNR